MSAALSARVAGVGAWGPGMAGWPAACAALAAPDTATFDDVGLPQATVLPSAERRRATPATRLTLAVAAEAIARSGQPADGLQTVFASSAGNPEIIDALCQSMASGDHAISPIRFHNSVHNAAAGYFGIATGNRQASTSLSGGDASAAAGLLDALVQVVADGRAVLFVSCDIGYPFPLSAVRRVVGQWAAALVLVPDDARAPPDAPRLVAGVDPRPSPPVGLGHPVLEAAAEGNPTGRLLPLLQALAMRRAARLSLPLDDSGHLRLALESAR